MYTVLDPKLNVVGFLSNKGRGANDFWGDTISQQIADTQDILGNVDLTVDNVSRNIDVSGNTKNWNHTLNGISFNNTLVGAQVENGYYLLYQDDANKRHYLMQLTSVSENVTPGGQHYKTATGVNAALYDFSRMIVDAKEFYASPTGTQTLGSLQNILRYILGHAGWNVNVEDYNFPDITYSISDGASVQSVLQDIVKLFEVDVDAYVTMTPQGQLAQRVVSFRQQMGTDSGVTIRYGKNMTDMTREELSDSIYTKLYVQGANSLKLNTMNNGLPYIVDEAANKLYNPVGASSSPETFREGVVVNSMITDERSLLAWGKKQLQALSHPRINYTISSIASTEAGLGDTIRVQDLYASQQILLTSRVIQKTISFANPTTNTLVLGEYSSVIGDKTKNVDLIAKLGQVADDITVVSEAAVKTQVIAQGAASVASQASSAASSAVTHANAVEEALSSAFTTAKSDVARLDSENKADTASLNSFVTKEFASASAQRTSLADTTSSMVADAKATSKSLADSAYAGAMAGVKSAGNIIAGVSAAVRYMDSTVAANKSAIAKVGSDLATGVASAAAYADSLTAKVGNSASAAVSSVAIDVTGVKAEFDSVRNTASELSVATNSLSVGASGIATKLTEVTSTASGAMSAAASLAADASGLHASYDKLSSQHAKDVETMNASYTAGISGIAASMATMKSTENTLTTATNSLAATASGLTDKMTSVSSTASGAMSAAASLAANVSGVSASFNKLSNTVTRKVVSETVDLNTYVTSGKWFFSGSQTNAPQSGWAYVDVDAPSTDRLIQTWTYDQDTSLQYSRYSTDNGNTWSSWVKAVQASDVTTAVNSASASYFAGINGLSADIKTVDTNAKGYATAAQNSAIATASQNATTITNTATTSLANGIAKTYATQTQLTQTASQFNVTATNLQNQVNAMGQINQLFNTEFSPDFQCWAGAGVFKKSGTYNGSNLLVQSNNAFARITSDLVPVSPGMVISASAYYDSWIVIHGFDTNKTSLGEIKTVGNDGVLKYNKFEGFTIPANVAYIDFQIQAKTGISQPMLVFESTIGDYVPGDYNNNARVSSLELDVDGITGVVNDPSNGLSATWNLANNGQTIAVQASNAATTALTTAQGVQTTVNNFNASTRNLIRNTAYNDRTIQTANWTAWSGPSNIKVNKDTPNSIQWDVQTGSSYGMGFALSPTVSLVTGEKYFVSFWAKASVAGMSMIVESAANVQVNVKLTTDWKRYTGYMTVATNGRSVYVHSAASDVGTLYLKMFSVVDSNIAINDWQPAPEDTDQAIQSVRTQLAGQINDEIDNRKNGDNSVRTQLTDMVNQQVTSVTNGYQTAITQASNAIMASVSGVNLFTFSRFEDSGNNKWPGARQTSGTINKWEYFDSGNNGISVTSTAAWQGFWHSNIPVSPGQVLSASVMMNNNGRNDDAGRFDIWFVDKSGNRVSQGGSVGIGSASGWVLAKIENMAVPSGAAYMQVSLINRIVAGPTSYALPMVNVGSKALPYTPDVAGQTALQLFQDNWAIGIKDNAGNLINGINGDTSGTRIAGKLISLDGNATVLPGFTLTVDHLVGNTAQFIKTGWDSAYSNIQIDGDGITIASKDNGAKTIFENGDTHWWSPRGEDIGYIGITRPIASQTNADYMTIGVNGWRTTTKGDSHYDYGASDFYGGDGIMFGVTDANTDSTGAYRKLMTWESSLTASYLGVQTGWHAWEQYEFHKDVKVDGAMNVSGNLATGGDINLGWTLRKNGTGFYPAHFQSVPGIHIVGTNSGIVFDESANRFYVVMGGHANWIDFTKTGGQWNSGSWDN